MFFFLLLSFTKEVPFIISFPNKKNIRSVHDLKGYAVLPENLVLFYIHQNPESKTTLENLDQLREWRQSQKICKKYGYCYEFFNIGKFDLTSFLLQQYQKVMNFDSDSDCPCHLEYYSGGLLMIHVSDTDEEKIFENILNRIHNQFSVAFLPVSF